ncbi:hypothetical protein [Pseudomonas orientalis]|uniref:hypothetical protein n=1 Tax=Pseudomonas orientalis TaxID=76758 RepID=UPI0034D7103D
MLSHQDIETVKLAENWFDSLLEQLLGTALKPAYQTGQPDENEHECAKPLVLSSPTS